ncbi:MAG TPA: hypothetical protein VF138_10795 [Caulobacteraceae bacterium]
MRKFLVPAVAAVTAAGALAVSTEASAQYYPYSGGNESAAIASAIQLAIGLLGSQRGYSPYGSGSYGGYPYGSQSPYGYGGSYPYGQSPYGYGGSYPYGQSPYGYGYGTSPYGYGTYQCRTERVWDGYSRQYVYRQVC